MTMVVRTQAEAAVGDRWRAVDKSTEKRRGQATGGNGGADRHTGGCNREVVRGNRRGETDARAWATAIDGPGGKWRWSSTAREMAGS